LQSSTAGLVYGQPLQVPSVLLVPAAQKVEASTFIQQLRRNMDQLQPTPAARDASPATFIHKDLRKSTHWCYRERIGECVFLFCLAENWTEERELKSGVPTYAFVNFITQV
jgi:hypothetical protein